MRNSWARAWLAATVLLVAASAIARGRHSMLLRVEEPVVDWLVDGTEISGWERAAAFGSPTLIVVGTVLLAIATFVFERRAAVAIVITSVFALVLTSFVKGVVNRPSPAGGGTADGSFPSVEIVQTGVFWGLVVLVCWWAGAPKLIWQVMLELAVFGTVLVTIHLVLSGQIWPSDAIGSAIIVVVSLIMAATVLEAKPPHLPARWHASSSLTPS